jgi:OOP family OmpA-OmpF porin
MKTLRNVVLATGMLALSGCTVFSSYNEVEALNEAQPIGSPFTQALATEYRDFSNKELYDMLDFPDALHFARKGLAAASGETVLPEPVTDWNLNENHIQELSAARGRLLIAYDLGARESAPAVAAKAQARFDCWIEEQEENWNTTELAGCKTDFFDAIGQLEANLQPPAPVDAVAAPVGAYGVDPSQPMAAENAMYLVFFNWDSADLGSGAMNVLDAVGGEVSKNPPQTVNVVGHTDTSGASDYNERLAFKRANTVRDALVQRGVDASLIAVDAKGENELLVATPDNIREPANRRVNISFR